MNRRDSRDACVLLATLWAAVAVQAQEVHKCTVNGQVTYQAKPCPGGPFLDREAKRQCRDQGQ